MNPDAPPPLGGRPLRGWRTLRCGGCGLTEALCLCASLPKLAVQTRVVVVMHYIEAVRSTNTGRVGVRMLEGASVRVRGAKDAPVEDVPAGRRLVLFPFEGARVLSPADAGPSVVLIVPDGTWSQARRIARRDPAAVGAEPVTLPASLSRSGYGLRRGVRDGGLCTLEAMAVALGVLEGPAVEHALLEAFERWHARALTIRDGL